VNPIVSGENTTSWHRLSSVADCGITPSYGQRRCGSRREKTWWCSGAVGVEDGERGQTVALQVKRTENKRSYI
jgi:hypothetical protein